MKDLDNLDAEPLLPTCPHCGEAVPVRGWHYKEGKAMCAAADPTRLSGRTRSEREPIDWSALTPHEVAQALRTIPTKVAYAWRVDGDGDWIRDDVQEYGCARAAMVSLQIDGTWSGPPTTYIEKDPHGHESRHGKYEHRYPTAEAAKTAYDAYLRHEGWLIDETDDGSGGAPNGREVHEIVVNGETVSVTQGTFDDGKRVWWELRRNR